MTLAATREMPRLSVPEARGKATRPLLSLSTPLTASRLPLRTTHQNRRLGVSGKRARGLRATNAAPPFPTHIRNNPTNLGSPLHLFLAAVVRGTVSVQAQNPLRARPRRQSRLRRRINLQRLARQLKCIPTTMETRRPARL